MNDVERELWKLGIPAKTRHNEVAPAQFELAPQFEELNLATDHNMLVMDALRNVAEKHGLKCLLHEKPYAGVNGSGKHNNWSVSYGGKNLLDPGRDPNDNALFLTMLCAVIEAVDRHADLLRASVAGAGNDHRLGANEAPPAVISIYVGDQLAEVLDRIEKGRADKGKQAGTMKLGSDVLPTIPKDATDRNRTSPFAFTGNKFEFRAPGSSVCCAGPMTVLNTIVAEAVDRIAGELEAAKVAGKAKPGEHTAAFHNALQKILQASLKEHKRVVFNGNGYEADWPKEAEKRGLPNAPDTPSALAALTKKENTRLFVRRDDEARAREPPRDPPRGVREEDPHRRRVRTRHRERDDPAGGQVRVPRDPAGVRDGGEGRGLLRHRSAQGGACGAGERTRPAQERHREARRGAAVRQGGRHALRDAGVAHDDRRAGAQGRGQTLAVAEVPGHAVPVLS